MVAGIMSAHVTAGVMPELSAGASTEAVHVTVPRATTDARDRVAVAMAIGLAGAVGLVVATVVALLLLTLGQP